jgi:hypothetical protein
MDMGMREQRGDLIYILEMLGYALLSWPWTGHISPQSRPAFDSHGTATTEGKFCTLCSVQPTVSCMSNLQVVCLIIDCRNMTSHSAIAEEAQDGEVDSSCGPGPSGTPARYYKTLLCNLAGCFGDIMNSFPLDVTQCRLTADGPGRHSTRTRKERSRRVTQTGKFGTRAKMSKAPAQSAVNLGGHNMLVL